MAGTVNLEGGFMVKQFLANEKSKLFHFDFTEVFTEERLQQPENQASWC